MKNKSTHKKGFVKVLKIAFLSIGLLAILIILLFGHRDIPLEELKQKYAQGTSSFITVDGMQVHFRDEGNSKDSIPIVLIHGTGSSLHTFDDWAVELKNDHRVIRMDLPAYGLTGAFPSRDYSIDAYVEFIKRFLDKLDIDQCIIGGNSLGGQISWRYTVSYPETIHKLILINAAGYPTNSESVPLAFQAAKTPVIKNVLTYITPKSIVRSSVENVYADKSKVTDELVDRYFELSLAPGNRQAFVDKFEAKRILGAHKQIPAIDHPTLVLWGDQDRLIPPENAHRFHQDLPNDTLVILENSGHVPMEENPGRSLEVLKSFLDHFPGSRGNDQMKGRDSIITEIKSHN